ncbi:MAG: transcriptional repressor LexA [Candidatus Pacebacteria bacterium]|nr:transcriptional repressor LexA [Candidatus Paceibacterota bacterium]
MIQEYKNKIIAFYQKHRRMPGYKEIMDITGYKSKNAVYKLINKLVEAGLISKDAQGKIVPAKSFGEIPVLGLVEAGFPTVAEEDTSETMSIDDYLIEHKEASYILEVKGDSMIEAGIQEGDLVIAERKSQPKEGDIVIAEVDGGWTMKYYRKKDGHIYLEPANKNYKPIYPKEQLTIAAIVKGVIRKY